MSHFTRLASLALLAAPLAACNSVENGQMGLVDFVPDNCGQSGCDLDDGLAVGATTEVYLDGHSGGSVEDLHIESSAPWIAEVLSDEPGLSPRATIAGNESGSVDLLAVDRYGSVIDWVTIQVVVVDELDVDVTRLDGPDLSGPNASSTGADLYFAAPDQAVDIDTRALAQGLPAMGRMDYQIETDPAMAAAIGDQKVGDGDIQIRLPAGEHDLTFETATAWRTLHFSVQ
jgi:hypothetical protein